MKKQIAIARILQILFVVTFVVAAVAVAFHIKRGENERQAFVRLADAVSEAASAAPDSLAAGDGQAELKPVVLSEYQQLYRQNPDMFGWISIPDTVLDYPVMYTPDDPERYLRIAFDKTYAVSGVPFMDASCFTGCKNYLIYGHYMKNGSMFGSLLKYADIEYYKQHPIIRFDTLYKRGEYEIVSAFYTRIVDDDKTDVFRYYEYTELTDQNRFDDFVKRVKSAALYDTKISTEYGDQFITLSTCSYHAKDGRFVVVAKEKQS